MEGSLENQPDRVTPAQVGMVEHVVARTVRSMAPAKAARILIVQRGTELIGALPRYVGYPAPIPFAPRPLRFISTGEAGEEETCAAYLDLLHAGRREGVRRGD